MTILNLLIFQPNHIKTPFNLKNILCGRFNSANIFEMGKTMYAKILNDDRLKTRIP